MADPKMVETGLPCVICRRPAIAKYHPFCSKRCADIDLGRWFTEGYRVRANGPDPDLDPFFAPIFDDDDKSMG